LFTGPAAPSTPDTSDHGEFFSGITPDSPALHFPKPLDPRTFARTDSHVPEWGRGRIFNQPRSRAGAPPPSTILQYAKAQEQYAAAALLKQNGAYTPRQQSRDKYFSDTDWTVKPALQGNGGLTNAVRAASEGGVSPQHKSWVGTLGFPTDALVDMKKEEIEDQLENEYDSLTVFVNDSDFDGHYSHYCKTILWPVFHYQIPDHPRSKAFEDHSWVYYVKINEAFAERVIRSYKHNDVVWIHDYHLLLVPGMIRKRLPDACIGFFLHTAFPSSEVFRCLSVRKQLLEGMLGANLIVFQADEYAHHFLQTCSRLLVVEVTEDGVQQDSHFVDVASVPIGIVPEQLMAAREEPEVSQLIKVIQERYRGKKLIVARDKLDGIRGVRQKLLSYELFLNKNPEWREKVVLIQVATSTTGENHDLENIIADIVTRVNSQHSTLAHQPLVFLKQDIAFSQYLALLTAADILMVTSLRDGMNLTCHEYVLCQDGEGSSKKHGPLILSEFTGSASVFKGAELSVNPWDYQQCARAIKHALEMSDGEKDKRYDKLHDVVLHHNGAFWVQELAIHLARAYEGHQIRGTMSVPRLSVSVLAEQYKASSSRLFILDYEGTLANWTSPTQNVSSSSQRVIDTIIDLLAVSDKNVVYIMSARTTSELEHVFQQVPSLGLIAENGCFVRPFNSDDWIDVCDSKNTCTWKEGVMSILSYYQERIEGSWIEERVCSFIFHFGECSDEDKESTARQAGDCANQIYDSCKAQRVHAVPIEKGLVVELSDFSKMTAAKKVLELIKEGSSNSEAGMRVDSHKGRENDGDQDQDMHTHCGVSELAVTMDKASIDPQKARLDAWGRSTFDAASSPTSPTATIPTVPDFLMVAGDGREDDAVFRWANGLGKGGQVKRVVSVCVGKRSTTEAATTLTQGVTGEFTSFFSGFKHGARG